jgi:hypothetical protein
MAGNPMGVEFANATTVLSQPVLSDSDLRSVKLSSVVANRLMISASLK